MSIKIEIEFAKTDEIFEAINSKIIQIDALVYAITMGNYPAKDLDVVNAYDSLIGELKRYLIHIRCSSIT